MYESRYEIVTQHITTKIARDIPTKRDTRMNVLNKLNAKMGGMNYSVCPDRNA